ncbi:MAG: hypothetical protein Q8S53_02435 [Brevundimonas sp.]|uniref:hypothetical protein n=1 Tax=Brevundimonas sp. TaxID=1871086 RepID=UPI0027359176|nr:hypothetical protein [Brevundimonas sp.]MDP3377195.1 hypothetical protein [Brevundimonas sp.]
MKDRLKRPAILSAAVIGALGLSLAACATMGPNQGTYTQRLDALMADCQARGGILTPIPGAQSGSPERDHACEIRGLPSSRTQ